MNPFIDFPDAQKAVVHARALADVARTPLAGFCALAAGLVASLLAPTAATWRWSVGLTLALLVTPFLLSRVLPRRGLLAHRIALPLYLLNGLLLALIAYREISRIAPLLPEEWPTLQNGIPWVAPVFAALYYMLQFHAWKERLLRLPEVRSALLEPPAKAVQQEIEALITEVLTVHPTEDMKWAEFRTVPASPRNWRLFLKLDSEVHGPWRVVFCADYAIVIFRDGSRAEAVKRRSLKIVAEDPAPGVKNIQCLLRWNDHLHEGLIAPEHFQRIQTWNNG